MSYKNMKKRKIKIRKKKHKKGQFYFFVTSCLMLSIRQEMS